MNRGTYHVDAERFDCCESRMCWWCRRGTVKVSNAAAGLSSSPSQLWHALYDFGFVPEVSKEYARFLHKRATKAIAKCAREERNLIPLQITGEPWDQWDVMRLEQLAGLQLTKEDEHELIMLSILQRQRERS